MLLQRANKPSNGFPPPKGHMELMPNGEGDKKAITGEPQVGTSGPIELI